MSLYARDRTADTTWWGHVDSLTENGAVLAIEVTRFDSSESPDLPAVNLLFSGRAPLKEEREAEARGKKIEATLTIIDEDFDRIDWNKDHDTLMHGTIDRGTDDGLRNKAVLFPIDSERRVYAKVEQAGPHTSRVKILVSRYSADESLSDKQKPIVGMQLQARP